MDNKNDIRYDMIIFIEPLTSLGLNLKFPEDIIIGGDGPYEGCSAPMFDLSNYRFKYLTDKIFKPEESFINLYVRKCIKYKSTISYTLIRHRFLDVKHEKAHLNKGTTEQYQHLTPSERENI